MHVALISPLSPLISPSLPFDEFMPTPSASPPIQVTPPVSEFDPESILRLEFEYARETIEEATEDRRKIFEFFILVAGALGSIAFALAQLDAGHVDNVAQLNSALGPTGRLPSIVFAAVFWLVGMTGVFTLLHLIRLRQAWHDSMLAMNRIKEFYIKRFPHIAEAFLWRESTIPPLNRWGSITFYMCLFVVMLDSLAFGAGTMFLDVKLNASLQTVAFIVGALAFGWQAFAYFWMLRE
jgi:hypothetical protein